MAVTAIIAAIVAIRPRGSTDGLVTSPENQEASNQQKLNQEEQTHQTGAPPH
jgi:hypothetical protein